MKDKDVGRCPVCDNPKFRTLYSGQILFSDINLIQCEKCRLTCTHPLPTDEIFQLYGIDFYYGKEKSKFSFFLQEVRNKLMKLRAGHFMALIPDSITTPNVLDIGCAEGRLLKAFHDYGCRCWGIEHAAYPLQRFLKEDSIKYQQGDLQTLDLKEGSFDLVVLWHVLEHMDEPGAVLKRIYRLLSPEGILVLAVPNFSSLEAKRFKDSWFHLDIPWHKYHFSDTTMECLIRKSDLRVIKLNTFCFEQGPYGLFQSILNKMGWAKNEFYEALKGNRNNRRALQLIVQLFMAIILSIPCLIAGYLESLEGKGAILQYILSKESSGYSKIHQTK